MNNEPKNEQPNAAQVRGDIQRGKTGDKHPGFDPAAAPLETDAESGGTPLSTREIETARQTQSRGKPQVVSGDDGSAMRPVYENNRPRFAHAKLFMILFVILLGLCATGLAMLYLASGAVSPS